MARYAERCAEADRRIKELEYQLSLKRDDPFHESMLEFIVSKDLVMEWALFHIEKASKK